MAMLDAFETVEKTETEPSGWVLYQDDTVLLAFGEEYATMRPGIWILADYFVGVESFILAYTPATTEPEEPEEPETPTVEKFPLMELIMGILSELNAGVNREPIAYLYNGVRLPKLPEWDRGVYPFAVIFASGAFWIMTELPYISSEGNTYALSAQYKIYTVQNGEYVLKSSSSGVQVGSAPIWSNSDLYNSNGTLYLEASDPVPVYE